MKQGRWIALAVLALGGALYVGARDAQRWPRPARPPTPHVADLPAEEPTDPWLPGMPGTRLVNDPFAERYEPTDDPLADLMRDIGADIRGLGDNAAGIGSPGRLVDLNDVTNGLEDGASSGGVGGSSDLPAAAALNPSSGAYFNDGRRSVDTSDFNGRVQDDVFAGNNTSPSGVPFGENAEPSSVGRSRDTGIFYNDTSDGAHVTRVENLFDETVRRFGEREAVEDGLAELSEAEEQRLLTASDRAERTFDERWKAIMADMDIALVPQVTTAVFPENWLDEIASRRQRSFWNRITSSRESRLVPSNFTPPASATEEPTPKPRTWKRAGATPNAVRLTVGDDDDLPLEAMDITVQIEGFRARVVLDCFFRNTKETSLNGSFRLRLPTGASPHYFAFGRTQLATRTFRPHAIADLGSIRASRTSTWEAPKEARMVSREQAAHAYTETIRERIDPALLEWAGAGVFAAQVFPLEAGALHHIVVAYDVDVPQEGETLVHRLDLPRGVPSLDVEIAARDGATLDAPTVSLADARRRFTNPKARQILTTLACPTPVVLTGGSEQAGPLFATEFVPDLPATDATTSPRAVFLLDVSASSTPERFNTWLALLEGILRENRETLREFAVLCFNVEAFWWKPGYTANTVANVEALHAFTHSLVLEGATDLGSALATAGTLPGDFDCFLLSDGGVTWGETDVNALATGLPTSHPLFAYTVSGGGTDARVLGHLARRSAGSVFPVLSDAAIPTVARAHRKRPWRLDGIRIAGGSDLMLAGRSSTLFPGQTLRLVGRGALPDTAEVELRVSQGDEQRSVRVSLGRRLDSAVTARTYGEVAVSQLESLGAAAADEARAYAAHFHVVGSSCSLLMLESEADYLRRGITGEDLAPVKTAPAAAVVAREWAHAMATLADPKQRFLGMLDRLESLPAQISTTLPEALRTQIAALPTGAFLVAPAPFRTTVRTHAAVPAAVRTGLASGRLSYDLAVTEAGRREALHGAADGLKALSTLIEQNPGDLTLARDVAFSALAWERRADAYHLLRRVTEKRPWESPTWLSIARCLDELGNADLALVFYELTLHGGGVRGFGALSQVTCLDYARLLRAMADGTRPSPLRGYAKERLAAITKQAGVREADILVVMEWNTDRTDVDLHIHDPAGAHCYYEKPATPMGGVLSSDVTTGFGPELFVLPRAKTGTYKFGAHYFGSDALRTKARSKIYARIYEDFGRSTQRMRRVVVTLEDKDSRVDLGVLKR